ncbi:MAG: DoxX family protein [Flavobacterium sp.]|nr:MAG: DoxX family protein [Flavobacterium sp.]
MDTFNKYDLGLLILRVGFSVFLFLHGIEKIEVLFESGGKFPNPIGIGSTLSLILVIIAEVLCTFLIVIGFKVRWASILPIIMMLVAVFVVHQGNSIMERELAVLYLIAFSAIAILGSGKYSVRK